MTAQATLDWQHEIHHAIIAALPNRDYELIAFNQAKSTAAMAVIVSWLQVLEKISSSRNLAASSLAIGILSGWPCWKSWARLAMSRCVFMTAAF